MSSDFNYEVLEMENSLILHVVGGHGGAGSGEYLVVHGSFFPRPRRTREKIGGLCGWRLV